MKNRKAGNGNLFHPVITTCLAQGAAHRAVFLQPALFQFAAAHVALILYGTGLVLYLNSFHHVSRRETPVRMKKEATMYARSSGASMIASPNTMQTMLKRSSHERATDGPFSYGCLGRMRNHMDQVYPPSPFVSILIPRFLRII